MRYGTVKALAPAAGYQPPVVLQPTGNYDAFLPVEDSVYDQYYDFPRAPFYQVHRASCDGSRPPDRVHPDGTQIWEMSYPNGPILYGPHNNIISPAPLLPGTPRGAPAMTTDVLGRDTATAELQAGEASDTFMRGLIGALGAAAALWLIARARKGRRR